MLAPFPANEQAEHEVFVQGNALFPFVYCGNGDIELLADFHDSHGPLKICNQYGKNKEQAISAIRDNDIREQCMGCLTGRA